MEKKNKQILEDRETANWWGLHHIIKREKAKTGKKKKIWKVLSNTRLTESTDTEIQWNEQAKTVVTGPGSDFSSLLEKQTLSLTFEVAQRHKQNWLTWPTRYKRLWNPEVPDFYSILDIQKMNRTPPLVKQQLQQNQPQATVWGADVYSNELARH